MKEAEVKTKSRKRSAREKKNTPNAGSLTTSEALVSAPNESGRLTVQARETLIEEAAYQRAEARNFEGDLALEDWLEAEAEVDQRFPVNLDQA